MAEAVSEKDVDLRMQRILPNIVQAVARMEVTHPEIVRVTPAYRALQHCAMPLRGQVHGDLFHQSRSSAKISTFWSHSWHGGHWRKILSFMTFYNSRAAVFVGMLGALVFAILFGLGFLPGIVRMNDSPEMEFSNWSVLMGSFTAALTLVLWRPQKEVFLDRICISQENELKMQAIFSLAGLLKKTQQMIILWDPTWPQRLWCLFELAAFLKSKGAEDLIIRPTIIGVISVGCFCFFFVVMLVMTTVPIESVETLMIPMAATGLVAAMVGYPTVSLLRGYFRSLDEMALQLSKVSFDNCRSSCCDQQHVSLSGEPMICDRKVVRQCVSSWFGSEEAFEESVKSEVLRILHQDLSEKAFSREWALGVTVPAFWADVDFAATYVRMRMWDRAVAIMIDGLVLSLIVIPTMKDVMLLTLNLYRHKASTPCREVLYNFVVMLLTGSTMVFALIVYVLTGYMAYIPIANGEGSPLLGSAAWLLCSLLQTTCSQIVVRHLRKRRTSLNSSQA